MPRPDARLMDTGDPIIVYRIDEVGMLYEEAVAELRSVGLSDAEITEYLNSLPTEYD